MAATDPQPVAPAPKRDEAAVAHGILLAALALPGLMPAPAQADSAPEHALIEVKTEHYQDSQPGLQRIKVDEPAIFALLPLGEHWSVAGSAVYDAVSGASPRYYSAVSGASRMHDKRYSGDGTLTYYGARSSYSVSYAHSEENDYNANSLSADALIATEDNNTALNIGLSAGRDRINPTNDIVSNEHRTTYAGIVGLTQALSGVDIAQVQLGYSTGHGYFSDPYKLFDNRPRRRNSETASLRWNHHFGSLGGTLRTSYRFFHDSYGIDAHTVELQWAQAIGASIVLTPGLRYYTQNAAKFYVDPPPDAPFPNLPDGALSTLDQRLSAFGAYAANQKIEWHLSEHWSTDLKGEYYVAKSSYRFIGNGSPGLDRFQYYQVQFGISYRF